VSQGFRCNIAKETNIKQRSNGIITTQESSGTVGAGDTFGWAANFSSQMLPFSEPITAYPLSLVILIEVAAAKGTKLVIV
jgi:hypothetical protein